jgi:hypothetical protein
MVRQQGGEVPPAFRRAANRWWGRASCIQLEISTMRNTYRRSKSRTNARRISRTKRWNKRRTTVKAVWSKKPKTVKSPFAKAFIAGCKKGQPCGEVINSISTRTGKSYNVVCKSLCKAGVCVAQKFNGQLVCWPNFKTRTSNAACKQAQCNLWQGFVDWCITSGQCNFKNLNRKYGTQAQFMKACRSLVTRQSTLAGTAKIKAGKSAGRTSAKPGYGNWSGNYTFPVFQTSSRRWTKAA